MTQRVPLYREVATLRVDTNRRNPGAVVRYIVSRLEKPATEQSGGTPQPLRLAPIHGVARRQPCRCGCRPVRTRPAPQRLLLVADMTNEDHMAAAAAQTIDQFRPPQRRHRQPWPSRAAE